MTEVLIGDPLWPIAVDKPVALSEEGQLRHNWYQVHLWRGGGGDTQS